MTRRSWLLHALLGCGIAALALAAAPAQNTKPPAKKAGDPAGTETMMAQWRAWFKKHDLDDDGYLDKDEIAKIFGYRRAYDYKPAAKDDKDKDKDKETEAKESESSKSSSSAPTTSAKDGKAIDKKYANRPDYLFLVALDKDGDEKVSKEEFETWAHDYCVQLLRYQEQVQKQMQAQQKLNNPNLTKQQQQQLQKTLKQEQQAANKMMGQMRTFEQRLMNALAKGR